LAVSSFASEHLRIARVACCRFHNREDSQQATSSYCSPCLPSPPPPHRYEALPALGAKKVKVAGEEGKVVLPEFICRSFYLHKKGKLNDSLPVYCNCKTPQNPEKTLIYCDRATCAIPGRWVHGQCIGAKGVSPSEISKQKQFYCPGCDGGSFFNCQAPASRGQKRKSAM
jgi:hypothetical protein